VVQVDDLLADAKLKGLNTADVQSLIDAAKQLLGAGDYDRAMALLQQAKARLQAAISAAAPVPAPQAAGVDWLPLVGLLLILGIGAYWYSSARKK